MAVEVFELLLICGSDRNLVVQPELRSGTELAEILHRSTEYGDVRRVRLSPAFQRFQAPPPAQSKGFLSRSASVIDDSHIPVGETPNLQSVVAKEVHTG